MQREIKFRIYDPVEKRMDYSPETFTGWLNDNFVFDGYADGEEPVVMQYTGLKDKNGKEIYEGDIILTPNYQCDPSNGDDPMHLFEVRWLEGAYLAGAYALREYEHFDIEIM